MKTELRKLLTGRGIELPCENEIGRLRELEGRWRALEKRRALVTPWRVAEDQAEAREAFLADPSLENELQIAVLADTQQTALRYAARHRAISELMAQLSGQAAELLAPFLAAVCAALRDERELREANKTTAYAHNDPKVKECRVWESDADHAYNRAVTAGQREFSPMQVAEFFVTEQVEEEGQ
ncbi:MAG: hypothetical protein IAE97_06900 [Chthoniobacterales bacterium]|nr:hypothetical protein [Chthoniobacterales bacterium]